jgi:serine/threonine-protein kinase HipA
VFPFAVADTEPDGWGRRVIARARAKQRSAKRVEGNEPPTSALSELDYLLGVDDISRVGALRFKRTGKSFERVPEPGERGTPPLLELRQIIHASHALERGTETAEDLRYLRGRGTSLGGMRPKCSLIDQDGWLAIGKFPSISDDRAVTKGEVLALRLAAQAGVNAAHARTVYSDDLPVTVVRRFDRVDGNRLPYASAATMLQAARSEDRSYTEIADQILRFAAEADRDLHELWRRIVFNLLITNVDDHLANHGFLHVEHGLWRLAPAFDLNPFPDKERELKTWLSAETGPSASLTDALDLAPYFHLDLTMARAILRQVNDAVAGWYELALAPEVDMSNAEARAFAHAFEHEGRREAERLLKKK